MPHSYLSFDLFVEVVVPLHVTGVRTDGEIRLTSVHSAQIASRTRRNDLARRLGDANRAEVLAELQQADLADDGPFELRLDALLRLRVRGVRNRSSLNVRLACVQGDGRATQAGTGLMRLFGEETLADVRTAAVSVLESGVHHLEARRAGRAGRGAAHA